MELVLHVVIIALLCELPGMPDIICPVCSEDRIFHFLEDYSQEGRSHRTLCWAAPRYAAHGKKKLKGSGYDDSYSYSLKPSKKPATMFDSVHITSSINWRYASTSTVATYTNTADQPQELNFSVKLPQDSFISSFTMIVNEFVYESKVKDGHLTEFVSGTSTPWKASQFKQRGDFSIHLRLAEGSKVVFNLTYQEILQRFKKVFRHAVHPSPNLMADDMRFEVFIDEPEELTAVDALWICTPENNQRNAEVSFKPGSKQAYVIFTPSFEDLPKQGNKGHFEVTYSVAPQKGGTIQVLNGYFVHFFSSDELGLVSKQVMFVIDVSGSMAGSNLQHTKSAVSFMLQQLQTFDHFNIMTFSNNVYKWRPNFVPAKPKYVDAGIRFLKKVNAHGGTNIKEALLFATKTFSKATDAYLSIIFLTDGVPTVGGTKSSRITRTVTDAIAGRIALFCIGIGDQVDETMLQQLATNNHGRYCNVEPGRKAVYQMKTFYDGISNPLLVDVRFIYDSLTVNNDSLSLTDFPGYLDGQEIIVSGSLRENFKGKYLNVTVEGNAGKTGFEYFRSQSLRSEPVPTSAEKYGNLIERFWALSKIKDLNRQRRTTRSTLETMSLSQQMMQISQKYGFVTPMTPIVLSNQNKTGVDVEELQSFELLGIQLPFDFEEASYRNILNVPASYQRTTPDTWKEHSAPISKVFGDPHFAIGIPGSNLTICFDVQKNQGAVLRLLSDPYAGLMVNAEIQEDILNKVTSDVRRKRQGPSMFGRFGISLGVHRILVLKDEIIIDDEISFRWKVYSSICLGEYNLTITDRENLSISNIDGLRMRIQRHVRIKHPSYFDFIVEDGRCLSPFAHGLIGQFQHKYFHLDQKKIQAFKGGQLKSVVIYKEKEVVVHKRNSQSKGSPDCWYGPAEQFVDGSINEYLTNEIFS
ncbi:Inter-alpha-trypsin inhibitor heavy chain H3 [Holothuria leucospilota]|uniref:Inter-alpha-trypsin inhibitor heavy chain H3 n=1 Tax=Holothuria leucospilota TaxID=206669 RepID=A0A9Q1CKH2_HOLLE|nr:Inter-alpha-trypsin inhibitor heavy chain H3 [Holothuria leucospilota]